jgi:hypothetical protein
VVYQWKACCVDVGSFGFLFYEDSEQAIITLVSDKEVLYSCGGKVYALYYYGKFARMLTYLTRQTGQTEKTTLLCTTM